MVQESVWGKKIQLVLEEKRCDKCGKDAGFGEEESFLFKDVSECREGWL